MRHSNRQEKVDSYTRGEAQTKISVSNISQGDEASEKNKRKGGQQCSSSFRAAAKGFREKVTTFREPYGEEEPRGLKTVVHVQQSSAQLPGFSWAI